MNDDELIEKIDRETKIIAQWETDAGLPGKVMKHYLGHYCGYVQVEFVTNYMELMDDGVRVHGGLTYGVDDAGWVGFDCAHAGDVCLDEDGERFGYRVELREEYGIEMPSPPIYGDGTEWHLDDVKEEVETLAEQLAEYDL